MKIELTKDEWEFLTGFLPFTITLYKKITTFDDEHNIQLILEKLGKEWVDDE